jgi:hypothetical protein
MLHADYPMFVDDGHLGRTAGCVPAHGLRQPIAADMPVDADRVIACLLCLQMRGLWPPVTHERY